MFVLASELDASFGLDHLGETASRHCCPQVPAARPRVRRTYVPSTPRLAFGLAAIAMTAITFSVLVALPATVEAADTDVALAPATVLASAFAGTR